MSGRSNHINFEAVSHHPHFFLSPHSLQTCAFLTLRCSIHFHVVKGKLGGWSSGRRRSFFMVMARRRRRIGQTKKRLAGLVRVEIWLNADESYHCCLSAITHSFQSSSHQAYCNGQVFKHIPKKFTIARRNLSVKLPMSSFCCAVVFHWLHFFGAVILPWCNWFDLDFGKLFKLFLTVNEETAWNFGFLNEPCSWLGTGNPATGQAS